MKVGDKVMYLCETSPLCKMVGVIIRKSILFEKSWRVNFGEGIILHLCEKRLILYNNHTILKRCSR